MATFAKPRRPIVAVLLAGVFPGLGQLYNGQRLKAAVFFALGVVTMLAPVGSLDVDMDMASLAQGIEKFELAALPFLCVALWSVIDAYRVARSHSGGREAR